MSSMNKTILIGNLGADPELRYTTKKQPVCNLRVATNETYLDKQGDRQQNTDWHRVVVWGKQAESCAKYLKKGRQVSVEGRMNYRQYDGIVEVTLEDGTKVKGTAIRTISEVVAAPNGVQFLGNSTGTDASTDAPVDEPAQDEAPPPDNAPF